MNKENWIAVRKNSLYDNFNLPPQAKAEAEEVFDGMRHLADESHDQAEFEKRLADSPLNMQYSELFTRFAKYVKLPENTPTQSEIIKGVVSDTAKSSVKSIVVNLVSLQCTNNCRLDTLRPTQSCELLSN